MHAAPDMVEGYSHGAQCKDGFSRVRPSSSLQTLFFFPDDSHRYFRLSSASALIKDMLTQLRESWFGCALNPYSCRIAERMRPVIIINDGARYRSSKRRTKTTHLALFPSHGMATG